MNCCDEYGNCRQGRDCPVRQERIERVRKLGREHRNKRGIAERVAPPAVAILILLAVWIGSFFHQAIESIT